MFWPAIAQNDDVTIIEVTATVQPGTEGMFEEFVAAHREASRDQELDNYWQSGQSMSGRSMNRNTDRRLRGLARR